MFLKRFYTCITFNHSNKKLNLIKSMKKLFVIAALLIACGCMQSAVQAQERKNVVKINPLSLGLATFNASYERLVTDKVSVQLGMFFTGISIQGTSFSGYGVTPEARFYFSKAKGESPQGWHISPFVRYQSLSISAEDVTTDTQATASISAFGGGAVAGYQWLLGKADRVSLDLFLGPKYDVGNVTFEGSASEESFAGLDSFSGFWIRSGLTLGVAF